MSLTPEEIRDDFRAWLVDSTDCNVQEAINGQYWPCGTCVIHLLNQIGLDKHKPLYKENNGLADDGSTDRHNEVWRAILQIRDAELETT